MIFEWKTHHHDGVFTSMIDIVEGRMIVTKHPHWKWHKNKEWNGLFDCYWKMSWLNLGFGKVWKWGMIKEGIDGDGKWCNWCYSKRYLWCGWL